MKRKIRMGMIGGGEGAFIGAVHRMAAALDGQIELVCGAFSSDPEKSIRSGRALYLPEERCYPNYTKMIQTEQQLGNDQKMDFVSIVTPNHVHFAPAKMALEYGFHVISDKPLCFSLKEAVTLKNIVDTKNCFFGLTHTYTGYPMVKQAKAMIADGLLGQIRKIVVEYPQGWLSTLLESSGQKQASWRTDPSKSGKAGAMGDIGTHAHNLAEYISGLKVNSVCAQINALVEGRTLDDDGNVLLKFNNGATGLLIASQISAGEENNLKIKIYGSEAGIEWSQMKPNDLIVRYLNQSTHLYRTGVGALYPVTNHATRLPAGHPEGYIEAFANIYKNFAACIQSKLNNEEINPLNLDFPGIEEGVRGMQFIDCVIASGQSKEKWISFD